MEKPQKKLRWVVSSSSDFPTGTISRFYSLIYIIFCVTCAPKNENCCCIFKCGKFRVIALLYSRKIENLLKAASVLHDHTLLYFADICIKLLKWIPWNRWRRQELWSRLPTWKISPIPSTGLLSSASYSKYMGVTDLIVVFVIEPCHHKNRNKSSMQCSNVNENHRVYYWVYR